MNSLSNALYNSSAKYLGMFISSLKTGADPVVYLTTEVMAWLQFEHPSSYFIILTPEKIDSEYGLEHTNI